MHHGKGNKAVDFYFVFGSFYQFLLKANKGIQLTSGRNLPQASSWFRVEKQDLSPYLVRLRSFRPYLEK